MRYIKCLLVLCVLSTLSFSFSFDDLEQLDKLDREDFAKEAKQKADNEEFKKAYNLLKKAKSIGINQTDYQSTKSYIQKKETAYQARLEKERKEKERKERERQARLERERQQSQSSSSSSYNVSSVIVSADSYCGFLNSCLITRFSMSGSPGYLFDTSTTTGSLSIHDNGRGVAGRYSYSIHLDNNRMCSGSVYITGGRKNATIKVDGDNCQANYHEY